MSDISTTMTDGPSDAPVQIILAHGAGAPADHPFMNAMAQGWANRGLRVIRFEFPYMAKRRVTGKNAPPDRIDVLRQTFLDVIASVADGRPLILAGKSMGGRVASLILEDAPARGVICLGYPFHPMGKPDSLRIEHLQSLSKPALIIQGSRDPMGNRDEVSGYPLSGSIDVHWLEDGDHSYKPRKSSGWTHEQHLATAVQISGEWIERIAQTDLT